MLVVSLSAFDADVLDAYAPNEQLLLARLSHEVVLKGIHVQSDPKAAIGSGVDKGEETVIICDFEQKRRIFARVARAPAPAARATINLASPPQSEYSRLLQRTRFEDYVVRRDRVDRCVRNLVCRHAEG
jgi:hypothetical protein